MDGKCHDLFLPQYVTAEWSEYGSDKPQPPILGQALVGAMSCRFFISPVLSRIIREETSRLRAAIGEATPTGGTLDIKTPLHELPLPKPLPKVGTIVDLHIIKSSFLIDRINPQKITVHP